MSEEYLHRIPLRGDEAVLSGQGFKLTWAMLEASLLKDNHMEDTEVIYQADVYSDGVVLLVRDR